MCHFISRIVASSYDKSVRAWDVETGKLLVGVPCPGVLTGSGSFGLDPGLGKMTKAPVFQEKKVSPGTKLQPTQHPAVLGTEYFRARLW